MGRRTVYYTLNFLVVAFCILLSSIIYWCSIEKGLGFINQRKGNFVLIIILIYILSYLLELINYSRDKKTRNGIKSILSLTFKLLIVIIIASFVELTVFFSTKLGRFIYFYTYLLISGYFIFARLLHHKRDPLIGYDKIQWLSNIHPEEVYAKFNINLEKNLMNDKKKKPDLIVFDYPYKEENEIPELVKAVLGGTKTINTISFIESISGRIPVEYIDNFWLLYNLTNKNIYFEKIKRFIDFSYSCILLLLIFPAGLLLAILNKLTKGIPIFFIQERVGHKGKTFKIIKFQTMVEGAEKIGPLFTMENDPRVTPIGKMMRKFRIDEIPQLLNVIKGDLSLVGPRPERRYFVRKYEKIIPFYRLRLEVKPGITGWAQVNYKYAGEDVEDHKKKLEYDFYYIKNRNLLMDFVILLKTMKTVLNLRGR